MAVFRNASRAFKTGQPNTFQRETTGNNGLRIPAHMTDLICQPLMRRKPQNIRRSRTSTPLGVLTISSRVAFIAELRKNEADGEYTDLLLNDLAEILSDLLDTGKHPEAPSVES